MDLRQVGIDGISWRDIYVIHWSVNMLVSLKTLNINCAIFNGASIDPFYPNVKIGIYFM